VQISEFLTGFLQRVAAYFQGYLSSLPVMDRFLELEPAQTRLTMVDSSVDESSEPLQIVRMNRALSRRMRWLIKRGHVQRPGELRIATSDNKARCNLTPGQFNEYGIRVDGWSRVRIYGLGFGRRVLRKIAIMWAGLQGNIVSLCRGLICLAPLSPD